MVIDCLSVFSFGFCYLSPFVRENFLFLSTSFSFIYSSISRFLIFYIFLLLCPLFFNLPASGLRGPSYMERNSTHVVLCIVYGLYGGAGRGGGGFVKFLPLPFLIRWVTGKVGICACLSALPFFRETNLGAEWDDPAAFLPTIDLVSTHTGNILGLQS